MSKYIQSRAAAYLREARLSAGCVSRSTATTRVPYSPETIGRHERGEIPVEPEDALTYARGYGRPDLLPRYCSDCPVGRAMGNRVSDKPLPLATLRIRHMIEEAQAVADRLEEIAFDGVIDESERVPFRQSIRFLRELGSTIDDMILLALKIDAKGTKGKKKAAPAATGSGANLKVLQRA